MVVQLPRQVSPQPANALASLDDLSAAELAIPKRLESDPIGDGPRHLWHAIGWDGDSREAA